MKHEQKRVGFSISVSSELLGTNADRGEQKVIDSLAQLWLRSGVRLVEGDHDPRPSYTIAAVVVISSSWPTRSPCVGGH